MTDPLIEWLASSVNDQPGNWFARQLALFNRQPLWGKVLIVLAIVLLISLVASGNIGILTGDI